MRGAVPVAMMHPLALRPGPGGVWTLTLLVGGAGLVMLVAAAAMGGRNASAMALTVTGTLLVLLGVLIWTVYRRTYLVLDHARLLVGRGLRRPLSIPLHELSGIQVRYQNVGAMVAGGVLGGVLGMLVADAVSKEDPVKGQPVRAMMWRRGATRPVPFSFSTMGKKQVKRWLEHVAERGVALKHGGH